MMKFCQYTRVKRKEAGLSMQDVVNNLGFTHRSMVHRRETGENEWQFSEIVKLAELLGIKLSDFIAGWERENKL